jgi:4'-phosphopantetheinyl transferase EntD
MKKEWHKRLHICRPLLRMQHGVSNRLCMWSSYLLLSLVLSLLVESFLMIGVSAFRTQAWTAVRRMGCYARPSAAQNSIGTIIPRRGVASSLDVSLSSSQDANLRQQSPEPHRGWTVGSLYHTVHASDHLMDPKLLSSYRCEVVQAPSNEFSWKSLLERPFDRSDDGKDRTHNEMVFDDELQLSLTGDQWASDKYGSLFIGGRLALRRAAFAMNTPSSHLSQVQQLLKSPTLKLSGGAPAMPTGLLGSISHKHVLIAAAVAIKSENFCHSYVGMGVDIERVTNKQSSVLAKRLLTENEQRTLGSVENGVSPEEDIMLRFGAKESFYKAAYPLLRRYIRFQEMEIYHQNSNTKSAGKLLMTPRLDCGRRVWVDGSYERVCHLGDSYWLTKVTVHE